MNGNREFDLNLIAALFTVLAALLSVIFTEGPYSFWDFILGAFVLWVCLSSRKGLAGSHLSRLVCAYGISLSLVIILFSVGTFLAFDAAETIRRCLEPYKHGYFDVEAPASLVLALVLWLYWSYQLKKLSFRNFVR